ncbi:AI-2E family transporter [Paenibacillus sp. DRB1-1]|uniref:AI-2E family transporter n=1 Tax=Paenibacillus sp. DRB1-1 TaxID=3422309 RepID=UPI003F9824CB
MLQNNRFFRLTTGIVMILLIIYLGTKVSFIFSPLVSLVSLLVVPLMLSFFLYYLLRPIVNVMERRKIKRSISILLIYLVIGVLLFVFSWGVWPTLRDQVTNLFENAPKLIKSLVDQLSQWRHNQSLRQVLPPGQDPLSQLSDTLNEAFSTLSDYSVKLVSFVSYFFIVLATFPILLYYMLKEGSKFGPKMLNFFPKKYHKDVLEVMEDIDSALSSFIVSRVLINVALGVMMFLGFLIIGLPYALLLAVISIFLNFIPYVGAVAASIPVVIIGFLESPSMALWSLVVVIAAQQIQDNWLSPIVFGKQLDIHPLTVVILLLVGGDLLGILGIILVIPLYMCGKIVIRKVYQLFLERRVEDIME